MRFNVSSAARRTPLLGLLTGFALLHVIALGLFARGFLLTRVELTTRSNCDDAEIDGITFQTPHATACSCSRSDAASAAEGNSNNSQQKPTDCTCDGRPAGCWGGRHFSKTAWVIVDALRFDFVACEGDAAAPSGCRSRMPRLLELAQSSVRAAPWSIPSSERHFLAANGTRYDGRVCRAQRRRCTNLLQTRRRPPCSACGASSRYCVSKTTCPSSADEPERVGTMPCKASGVAQLKDAARYGNHHVAGRPTNIC